ncbi:MAG: 2-C-methyl-D-erythritol 2,4-cyclodiphosphate synthase [Thermodesulfovibrionales bacterium]|nr:2-C-methyl-D-erythritol 2,4-cyclodiphosphate synthase [Thermodesulfovibrionales bacterium]
MRVGIGYDSHKLTEGRMFILGGVEIPSEKGLEGHSDGDALCHAIIDAILGAIGEGDIGKHFPDTDLRYKGVSSLLLLTEIVKLAQKKGFEIIWVDTVIIAEKPKLSNHIDMMKEKISSSGISQDIISIKAKTNEGMGFVGKGEGIAVLATCLLRMRKRK